MNQRLVLFGALVIFFGAMVFMYFQYTGVVEQNNRLYFDLRQLAEDTDTNFDKWVDCQRFRNNPSANIMPFGNRDCGLNE